MLLHSGSADKTVKFWDLETFELIGSTGPEVHYHKQFIVYLFAFVTSDIFFSMLSIIVNFGVGVVHSFVCPIKKEMENEQKEITITLFDATLHQSCMNILKQTLVEMGTYLIHLNYCLMMSPSKLSDNRCSFHDIQS